MTDYMQGKKKDEINEIWIDILKISSPVRSSYMLPGFSATLCRLLYNILP